MVMKQLPAVLVLRIVVLTVFVCGGVLYPGLSTAAARPAAQTGVSPWMSRNSGGGPRLYDFSRAASPAPACGPFLLNDDKGAGVVTASIISEKGCKVNFTINNNTYLWGQLTATLSPGVQLVPYRGALNVYGAKRLIPPRDAVTGDPGSVSFTATFRRPGDSAQIILSMVTPTAEFVNLFQYLLSVAGGNRDDLAGLPLSDWQTLLSADAGWKNMNAAAQALFTGPLWSRLPRFSQAFYTFLTSREPESFLATVSEMGLHEFIDELKKALLAVGKGGPVLQLAIADANAIWQDAQVAVSVIAQAGSGLVTIRAYPK